MSIPEDLDRPSEGEDLTERRLARLALEEALAESRKRETEMAALLGGARSVLEYHEFEQSARAIFDACKGLIGAAAGYVALLSEDGSENELAFLDAGGLPCNVDPSLPMPIRGLRAEAYRSGKVVYENDFASSEYAAFMPEGHADLHSVMFAPLVVGGKTLGIMGLANKPAGFDEKDARLASGFGEMAALALFNARTLEALEDSEERFRSITETATDAIVSANAEGEIILWNKAAKDIFGYSAEEALGRPLAMIMSEERIPLHEAGMQRLSLTGESRVLGRTVECRGLRKDGTEFPIELSLASGELKDGRFFTGIVRDITERKAAEEELAWLASFPRKNPLPVIEADYEGNVTFANPSALRRFPDLEAAGFKHPVLAPIAELAKKFQAGAEQSTTCEVEADDHVFELSVWHVPDRQRVRVYGIDVTERHRSQQQVKTLAQDLERRVQGRTAELQVANEQLRREMRERQAAEEARQATEAQFSYLFDVVPVGIGISTVQGEVLAVNPAFEAITGYRVDELRAARGAAAAYFDRQDRHKMVRALAESGRISDWEVRLRRKDGQLVDALLSVERLTLGGREVLLTTARDVTERKRLEDARIESEQRLLEAQRIARFGNWDWDIVSEQLRWSDEIYRIFGLSPQEFGATYDAFLEYVHYEDREAVNRAVQEALAHGQPYGIEHRVVRPDGSIRVVQEQGEVTFDDSGRPVRMVGTVQDVTERKQAEEALVRYQQQLRDLAAQLSLAEERERRRIAVYLHDSIVQTLGVLKNRLAELSDQVTWPDGAMPEDVRGLVDEAITDARSLTFELSPPILYELGLEAAVEWLAEQVQERYGLRTVFHDDGQPKPLDNDVRVLLFQAVRELLVNAAKHSQAKHVQISMRRDGLQMFITTEDDGVGFDTGDMVSARTESGHFGLFSIRERLDHVGGRLYASSSPGKGARFTLSVPLSLDRREGRDRPEGEEPS